MRVMPMAVLLAAMMAVTVSGCTKSRDRCCDRCYNDYGYRVLRDGCDCLHRHWYASRYREFFNPDDFGRGQDSLYGSPQARRDGDYSNFNDGESRQWRCDRHGRGGHHRYRYHEDAVSERYAPTPAPDSEYDE